MTSEYFPEMEFCPECKSIMMPKDELMICRKCGNKIGRSSKAEFISVQKQVSREVPVLEGNVSLQSKTKAKCPACGNGMAYWEMKQTRRSDEPPTLFLTCTKCGNRWRKY
ncbi:MAG: transcription factor S [Methanotrichaceae archaeon]|nr:transcription factor S [Methanotrichaceae archaeon]